MLTFDTIDLAVYRKFVAQAVYSPGSWDGLRVELRPNDQG